MHCCWSVVDLSDEDRENIRRRLIPLLNDGVILADARRLPGGAEEEVGVEGAAERPLAERLGRASSKEEARDGDEGDEFCRPPDIKIDPCSGSLSGIGCSCQRSALKSARQIPRTYSMQSGQLSRQYGNLSLQM